VKTIKTSGMNAASKNFDGCAWTQSNNPKSPFLYFVKFTRKKRDWYKLGFGITFHRSVAAVFVCLLWNLPSDAKKMARKPKQVIFSRSRVSRKTKLRSK
jgi:hypothetical protein